MFQGDFMSNCAICEAAVSEGWIGVAESCKLLGVSAPSIYNIANRNKLNSITLVCGHRRFNKINIEEIIKSRKHAFPAGSEASVSAIPDKLINITEAARQLQCSAQQVRNYLTSLGISIEQGKFMESDLPRLYERRQIWLERKKQCAEERSARQQLASRRAMWREAKNLAKSQPRATLSVDVMNLLTGWFDEHPKANRDLLLPQIYSGKVDWQFMLNNPDFAEADD
jgi:predicted DNA-binding transcriptional regulator AlpA